MAAFFTDETVRAKQAAAYRQLVTEMVRVLTVENGEGNKDGGVLHEMAAKSLDSHPRDGKDLITLAQNVMEVTQSRANVARTRAIVAMMREYGRLVRDGQTYANFPELWAFAHGFGFKICVYRLEQDGKRYKYNGEAYGPDNARTRFAVEHVMSALAGEGNHYQGLLFLSTPKALSRLRRQGRVLPGDYSEESEVDEEVFGPAAPRNRKGSRTRSTLTDSVIDKFIAMREPATTAGATASRE